eukprot:TRINITY_DN27493_c0_g1_i2.p1 TRINITY_DN27493_c0_g1~~TRINITY_DN27493_c0_g1_i2.p1  ORF type:complete len:614 (+),score=98.45 TRINITY_DN27493_c0_g1_i2:77-1843(+)
MGCSGSSEQHTGARAPRPAPPSAPPPPAASRAAPGPAPAAPTPSGGEPPPAPQPSGSVRQSSSPSPQRLSGLTVPVDQASPTSSPPGPGRRMSAAAASPQDTIPLGFSTGVTLPVPPAFASGTHVDPLPSPGVKEAQAPPQGALGGLVALVGDEIVGEWSGRDLGKSGSAASRGIPSADMPQDEYGYWHAADGFAKADAQMYDAAYQSWKHVRLTTPSNFVALLGLRVLHDIGSAEMREEASPENVPLESAARWLRCRDARERKANSRGSPSAVMALAEYDYIVGDTAQSEGAVRNLAQQVGYPLARLRAARLDMNAIAEKARGGAAPEEVTRLRGEVVQSLVELARLQDRAGAAAGRYLWAAYYKGEDGLEKDLRKAETYLKRCVKFGIPVPGGKGQGFESYLRKVQKTIAEEARERGEGTSDPHRTPPLRSTSPVHLSATYTASSSAPRTSPRQGSPAHSPLSSTHGRRSSLQRSDSGLSNCSGVSGVSGISWGQGARARLGISGRRLSGPTPRGAGSSGPTLRRSSLAQWEAEDDGGSDSSEESGHSRASRASLPGNTLRLNESRGSAIRAELRARGPRRSPRGV